MALRTGHARNPEGRMRLVEHLRELRRRVLLALAGIVVMAVVSWFFYEPVFDAIQAPVRAVDDSGLSAALNFTSPAAAFDMQVRVSLWLAVFLASPWWLYQLWAYVAPGLTRSEKRRSMLFVVAGVPLFLAGAVLAWMVLPNAIRVLTQFTPEGALNYMPATDYVRFVMRVVLAFAIAFLVPLVMVLLNAIGLVSARALLGGWRWAVLLVFVFAGIASPTPDPWTMIALAVPMCALYFGAVGIAALHDRRAERRRAAHEAELLEPDA
ncbi:Sec-independent protein translocase TatC [Georgenia satyanarayanai]|uniref:Sec-independent protein translocase protein TatC n=1 Tax=Georgenia satyanarayanai TaxID=860221 RepID=A0A2Y9A3Q0_9MICO|nr:twin-arginine translocase subunit TatC [Georgenia satyanarayanai]PYG02293.1 Sec-independent protein translocase TatC [Georgenia satyanarayanai]SSA37149.1 Sec-independent protein translocase TatC [Georgenia satyanarayanai]